MMIMNNQDIIYIYAFLYHLDKSTLTLLMKKYFSKLKLLKPEMTSLWLRRQKLKKETGIKAATG